MNTMNSIKGLVREGERRRRNILTGVVSQENKDKRAGLTSICLLISYTKKWAYIQVSKTLKAESIARE